MSNNIPRDLMYVITNPFPQLVFVSKGGPCDKVQYSCWVLCAAVFMSLIASSPHAEEGIL